MKANSKFEKPLNLIVKPSVRENLPSWLVRVIKTNFLGGMPTHILMMLLSKIVGTKSFPKSEIPSHIIGHFKPSKNQTNRNGKLSHPQQDKEEFQTVVVPCSHCRDLKLGSPATWDEEWWWMIVFIRYRLKPPVIVICGGQLRYRHRGSWR